MSPLEEESPGEEASAEDASFEEEVTGAIEEKLSLIEEEAAEEEAPSEDAGFEEDAAIPIEEDSSKEDGTLPEEAALPEPTILDRADIETAELEADGSSSGSGGGDSMFEFESGVFGQGGASPSAQAMNSDDFLVIDASTSERTPTDAQEEQAEERPGMDEEMAFLADDLPGQEAEQEAVKGAAEVDSEETALLSEPADGRDASDLVSSERAGDLPDVDLAFTSEDLPPADDLPLGREAPPIQIPAPSALEKEEKPLEEDLSSLFEDDRPAVQPKEVPLPLEQPREEPTEVAAVETEPRRILPYLFIILGVLLLGAVFMLWRMGKPGKGAPIASATPPPTQATGTTKPGPTPSKKPTSTPTSVEPATTKQPSDLPPGPIPATGKPTKTTPEVLRNSKRLLSIAIDMDGETTILRWRGDGNRTRFSKMTLSDPPRFVIDLPGLGSSDRRATIPIRSPLCSRVRVGHHADKIRYVLDLARNPVVEASEAEGVVQVRLRPR